MTHMKGDRWGDRTRPAAFGPAPSIDVTPARERPLRAAPSPRGNEPRFVAGAILGWLPRLPTETAFSDPDNPWENATHESFNGKFYDES